MNVRPGYRSAPATTTNGSYDNGHQRRGHATLGLLGAAAGLVLASGLVINGIVRDQSVSPPSSYEGPVKTVTIVKGDTISKYTLDCPVEGVRDQNYWNREVLRLNNKENTNLSIDEELIVPVCYRSEVQ